jgi:hypothetical protein
LTSIRRGVKNVKHRLGDILAAAACLVAATAPPPALAQEVVDLDVGRFVYTLQSILFPIPKDNPALLAARRKDADALRARFADCESGLADARAHYDVIIDKQRTIDPINLLPAHRDLLDKTGLGHLTPPETTSRGVELFAVCGAGPTPAERLYHPRWGWDQQRRRAPVPDLGDSLVWRGMQPVVQMQPFVLVVPDFAAPDPQLRQTAADMARFIGSVLQRSCHYKLINIDDIGDKVLSIDGKPDISHWSSIKSDIVVAGRLTEPSSGQLLVEVRMWDVRRGVEIYAHSFVQGAAHQQRRSWGPVLKPVRR